jgi:hypothetical protein
MMKDIKTQHNASYLPIVFLLSSKEWKIEGIKITCDLHVMKYAIVWMNRL